MRIGIAQIDTVAGAFSQTVGRMLAQSQRAAEQGVDLLVFPLAALAGVEALPYADRISFMHDVARAVTELSENLSCPAIVPAPVDAGEGEGFYDVLMFEHGEVRSLWQAPAGETGSGDSPRNLGVPVFSCGGIRMALALSHADLDNLDELEAHRRDLDAILYVSGYPFAMDDPSSAMGADLDNARFIDIAQNAGVWFVGAASVGGYGDEVFSGSSFVLAPTGELAALAPAFEEALLVADIERPAPERLAEPLPPEVFDAPFHLWQALTLGIHDYAAKNGFTEVALCLDGSLGSTVLAALACDAMGPLHVHALIGASAGSAAPACRELARRLRIDAVDATGHPRSFDIRDLDELELAELARTHQALVLSPQDKTSLALGTRAPQVSSAMLCPLGDVYRSDVLDMAHVRNTISPLFRRVALTDVDALTLRMPDGSERVIASEQELIQVDELLLGYVEYDRPLAELIAEGKTDPELADAVLRAYRRSEPWRRSAAPVLAMSTHTLDDARFPLGVRWHDTHLDLLDMLPELAELVAPAEQESLPKASYVPKRASDFDLNATLAMLRDLAEQGGLAPTDLVSLSEAPEGHRPEDLPAGSMGWMLPFSEN